MASVSGCDIREDRYYWVEKHVWVQQGDGDMVVLGMTDVAQHLASSLVAVTPKKVGRTIKKGKSVATVESGKFVGPVPTPLTGEVIEVNDALVGARSAIYPPARPQSKLMEPTWPKKVFRVSDRDTA